MITYSNEADVVKHHENAQRLYNATEQDCYISDMETIPNYSIDYRDGFRTRYLLNAFTYKGWKVIKMHSGCFASKPQFETLS